jgi:hypothetical protein
MCPLANTAMPVNKPTLHPALWREDTMENAAVSEG